MSTGLFWELSATGDQRAKVFGGWIVKTHQGVHVSMHTCMRPELGYEWRIATCFVPDAKHEWDWNTK